MRLSELTCKGRVKAYNVVLTALQLELDDPKEDEVHETLEEYRYLLRRFARERINFANKHDVSM